MQTAENVYHARARLGEGPLWDEETRSLYFVDIYNHRVHRLDPATGEARVYEVGELVACAALAAGGTLLLGLRHHLGVLDLATGEVERRVAVETALPTNRLNDGKCDPQGRFWFGSMSRGEGGASLYRLDLDGSVHRMETGLTISNGLGWSPDGGTFYLTDSPARLIYAYPFDAEAGALGERRVLVDLSGEPSFPDGLAVDEEGCLWSAQWDGWGVIRFAPDGREVGRARLPVKLATSCAFGGAELRELYLTTASVGLSQEEIEDSFYSGDLFRLRADVAGLPVARFAGSLPAAPPPTS